MKFKKYRESIEGQHLTGIQQILFNRGLDLDYQQKWLNASKKDILPWQTLNEPVMREAVKRYYQAIQNNEDIMFIVDCDADGYTSSAIVINYTYEKYPDFAKEHISWIHHDGKQHGLADTCKQIPKDTVKLVVCPDSASNDIQEHIELHNAGIDVIVLDHHEYDPEIDLKSPAYIINVQGCDYPNKALTGAGVSYKFICAFEDLYGEGIEPEKYLDLCAIGNCGDMADYQELEIRAIMQAGLSHITNPYIYAMCEKNKYSIDKMNGINYRSMSFYVVPYINATVRVGDPEDKELLFKGMLNMCAFEKIPTSKRGGKGTLVNTYEEALLVTSRIKLTKQKNLQTEAMDRLTNRIKEQHLLDNSVLLLLCEPGEIDRNLAGLVANQYQAKYQRPCLVLTRTYDEEQQKEFFRGSMRNYTLSEFDDLKKILESTGDVEWCQGHANAAGVSIPTENLNNFIKHTNEIYSTIDQTASYWVDYIWDSVYKVDMEAIRDIGDATIFGQNVEPSLVVLENIPLDNAQITLMKPDSPRPTLKVEFNNGLTLIKWNSSQEEYESFLEENAVITLVGTPKANHWRGQVHPQIEIEDYELRQKWIF